MKFTKMILLLTGVLMLTSCASGYKLISPQTINYMPNDTTGGVTMEYKYNLLKGKYAKKETKKKIKLVAVKVTNHTEKDLVLGRDIQLVYQDGSPVYVMDHQEVFTSLRQSVPSYLFYLLLSPLQFITSTNGEDVSTFPVGLIVGPGLAGGNMIAAGAANKKFREELLEYNIFGTTVKSGETVYGLIGIHSETFNPIKINLK